MVDALHHNLPLLPPDEEINPPLQLLTEAYMAIGELKGRMFQDVINPNLIIGPLLNKEAVASSKIEGTQTTVKEVLTYEAKQKREEDPELREVINYRKAIYEAVEFLEAKPTGEHLIKRLHSTLLISARGKEKDPGNFRRTDVHVGRPGSSIEEALYVPPKSDRIVSLIQNWIKYVHEAKHDDLLKVAIAHYQFEAIHPFMDGNGRIGRLLIPITLYEYGIITYPYFYISEYIEHHREEYYQALRGVDRERDWNTWIRFFLTAVKETATRIQSKVIRMYDLYSNLKSRSLDINSQYSQLLIDLLFEQPIISAREITRKLEQPSKQTLYNLMEKFEKEGILREITGQKRNKIFAFDELIRIID